MCERERERERERGIVLIKKKLMINPLKNIWKKIC